MGDEPTMKDYTIIEAAHIKIAQTRKDGYFYDIPERKETDKVVHFSVKIGKLGKTGYFVAVLDSHGINGTEIALSVADNVSTIVPKKLEEIERVTHNTIEAAVKEALQEVSDQLNEAHDKKEISTYESGTTICASLIMNNMVYTWQIGDSLALKFDESENRNDDILEVQELSSRHNLANKSERSRITGKGGKIARLEYELEDGNESYGLDHIFLPGTQHSLAKTRTIGDHLFHKHCGVIDTPEFSKKKINYCSRYLVFVTDESLEGNTLSEIIGKNQSADVGALSKLVLDFCVEQNEKNYNNKHVRDDISVVIVELGGHAGGSNPPPPPEF